MVDLFISYKRQERDAVTIVAQKLRDLKFNVWFDEALRAGTSYDEEIASNLKAARVVLVCWTPAAIASEWVRAEAAMAHNEGKLLACFLEPTELDVPPFNLIHAENLMAWGGQEDDEAWLGLVARIGELTGRTGAATYYRTMRPEATVAELRGWAQAHGADPLAQHVWDRVAMIEGETSSQRIAREKAEAHARDLKRVESAARSKALAKVRGLRDPKEQSRRLLRVTLALIAIGLLAGGGVAYSIYSGDRLRELDKLATVEDVRAFMMRNSFGPIHDEAMKKLQEVDAADWAKAQGEGTIQAYNAYISTYSKAPTGQFVAAAMQARAASERIAEIQRLLARLRLYDGQTDGKVDSATYDAITLFQFRRGEVVTGAPDERLIEMLKRGIADRIALPPEKIPPGRVGPPTEDEYRRIAARLKVDGPSLIAIFKVEAQRAGIAQDGRAVILFEPHVFSRLTEGKYDESHPLISSRSWRRELYGADHASRWAQLSEAHKLDPEAAYASATYGAYQIMGTHFRRTGFETASEYVQFISESEANQLETFVRFVASAGILDEIQRRDWYGFARRYHGPSAVENYVRRLTAAYEQAKADQLAKLGVAAAGADKSASE